jgi:ferredoxin, 2Fe-2S
MPLVNVILKDGSSKQIKAETGWSLMEILRDDGIEEIEGACGGSMACATCHMIIHPDWAKKLSASGNEKCEEEEDILDLAFDLEKTSRLGCQIRLSDELDGIIIAVPGAKTNW